MGKDEDDRLCDRFDTLDSLYIKEGELGRGLFLRKNAIRGEILLVLPPSSLLHVGNAIRFAPKELIPSSENPSHKSHWIAKDDPEKVSLNAAAVGHFLPLTSVQILTLILALWKAKQRQIETKSDLNSEKSEDESYLNTFLSTYPSHFPTLPLSWQSVVEGLDKDQSERANSNTGEKRKQDGNSDQEDDDYSAQCFFLTLLENLPTSIRLHVQKVRLRFDQDIRAIEMIYHSRPDLINKCMNGFAFSKITIQDWIWSWSSVNSRCVFLQLGLKPHGDNFTLAPLLDMANHTMEKENESKVTWFSKTKALQLKAPKPLKTDEGKKKDEEIFISYGSHSNGYLLAEYGFVLPSFLSSQDLSIWNGNPFAEVKVDHLIDQILESQGRQGKAKIELLKEYGYYGEYTIHPYPAPAHPSYRLLLAARLIALDLKKIFDHTNKSSDDVEIISKDPAICAWTQVVQGLRDEVDSVNEKRMHSLLLDICDSIHKQNKQSIDVLEEGLLGIESRKIDCDRQASHYMSAKDLVDSAKIVIAIQREEIHIANMLKHSIETGQTDW